MSQVRLLRDTSFVVSDARGDIHPGSNESGLFFRDMRHLSEWEIRIDGRLPQQVSGEATTRNHGLFFLAEHTASLRAPPAYTLVRHRRVAEGLIEVLRLTNHDLKPRAMQLTVLLDADFADVMAVGHRPAKRGRRYVQLHGDQLTFGYARDGFERRTVINAEGAFVTERSLTFQVTLEPGRTWEQEITVSVATSADSPRRVRRPAKKEPSGDWLAGAPRLESANDHLRYTYQHSLVDLAALSWKTDVDGLRVPGAGLPNFMALFGRDALLTSHQALPFAPEMCRDTLLALAAYQATAFDDATDAEPGKILHELRLGEVAHFGDQPYDPYYGGADITPLFLIVLDEYERWTGDVETVRELETSARAALDWLTTHADRTDAGFVQYRTRNPDHGLANQCWKDSDDAVVHPDGTFAELPRATCEIQGYAYDARRRTARLCRQFWDDAALADQLEQEAEALRTAFIEAFWLPDEGFYALALDGGGRPVRTLTSNIGHLLWSGIVPDEHVDAIVGHLMSARLFSGWGVRTLAEGPWPYNPMGYHTGTVWPHDSAIVALGLARYGRRQEAVRLAETGLTAAAHLDHRLPEAIIGVARSVTRVPVPLPGAAWPHAWSCGAPLLFMRVLFGLEPTDDGPVVLPRAADESLGEVQLRGLRGRWGRADVVRTGPTGGGEERDWLGDVAGSHF